MRKIRTMPLPGTSSHAPRPYEKPHALLSRTAAAEGFVLLKNEDHVLPLALGSAVALYGAGAAMTVKGGTGSGDVNERYSVSIAEGMERAGFCVCDRDWLENYAAVYAQARQDWKAAVLSKFDPHDPDMNSFFFAYSTTPFYLPVGAKVEKCEADTAIYVLGRIAGEGADRFAVGGDYYLSDEEHQMLADLCALYRDVIVLINAGGVVDLSFLDEFQNIKALLVISQPGMEGGNAVADVLSGAVTPSGKLTDSWAFRYEDYPNAASFSHSNGDVAHERYEEGIYVGYRYFDSFGVPVRYGFGEGLSYTTFSIEAEQLVSEDDGTVQLTVRVKNTGSCAGREVVQVYVSLPEGRLEKEARRLCAFAKTKLLQPDEEELLELAFAPEALASYDEAGSAWLLEAGRYGIFVGASLARAVPVASLQLSKERILTKTRAVCPLQEPLTLLSCPESIRRQRYATLEKELASLPAHPYDLSAVKTVTVDYADREPTNDEAAQIVDRLSAEQLIALAIGDPARGQGSLGAAGVSVPGSAGETSSCALEEGVANIVLADGPAGLRLNQFYSVQDGRAIPMPLQASLEHGLFYEGGESEGETRYQFCTAIPVGTLLAQTWDLPLLETVGKMIGEEMALFNVTLWLAPGMNIHRNPLCGRNFEYYAEDPLLSGKMAAAITRGVQRIRGCGTTIKHFACNNQEDNRMGSNSIVSERTLRELYLRGFGIAIREAKPMSIMTSYNLINGVHAANSRDLCTMIARREFGFDGCIMTDWTTTEHGPDCTAAGCMRAGNDLVMPGRPSDHESIRSALADGSLTMAELKSCIRHTVRIALRADRYEK